jgi:ribosomal subunit interface protein
MKFEYTGRHVEVSPAIRRHVEDHFKKLDHVFNGDSTLSTHVIIDVEKNRQIGEIIVYWRDYTPEGHGEDRETGSQTQEEAH